MEVEIQLSGSWYEFNVVKLRSSTTRSVCPSGLRTSNFAKTMPPLFAPQLHSFQVSQCEARFVTVTHYPHLAA